MTAASSPGAGPMRDCTKRKRGRSSQPIRAPSCSFVALRIDARRRGPQHKLRLRLHNRRLNQASELAGEINRHPGVHGALTVKKPLRAPEAEHPLMPDVGMNVEALPAVEPEADEPFRCYIVAG